jgi:hypothetical protein
MVPIDLNDGVFKLAVTHLDDKISDQPRLRNPEMVGLPDSTSARITIGALGTLSCNKRNQARGSWASLQLIVVVHLTRFDSSTVSSSFHVLANCNLPFSPLLAGVSDVFTMP